MLGRWAILSCLVTKRITTVVLRRKKHKLQSRKEKKPRLPEQKDQLGFSPESLRINKT